MPLKEEDGVVTHSLKGPTITHYTEVQAADESGEWVSVSVGQARLVSVSLNLSRSVLFAVHVGR